MEIKYNVKYKFKMKEQKTNEQLKDLFNKKWLNIIMLLESQEYLRLNKS